MSQLLVDSIPGFVDLDDANLAADQPLTDDTLIKLSQNAKFAAVRCERIPMGFYVDGDTVGAPVSPVDGYQYSQEEVLYDFSLYSTRLPAAGFVSGQATPPGIAGSQTANLYWPAIDIDDATGLVSIYVSYYKQGGAETITHDGSVKVYAICQRQSVNTTS